MKRNLLLLILITFAFTNAGKKPRIEIGVAASIENDSLLHALGFQYMIESVPRLLSPRTVTDEQFTKSLQRIRSSRIPLFACNIFIPGELKVVGPDVDTDAVLKYAEVVFNRAQTAGIKMIVWGSGGSRRVPEGFDHNTAQQQFITIAKSLAVLAKKYDVTLALESLNKSECNFINTAAEALVVVKAVDHPNLRLCVDFYHMLKEDESPEVILNGRGYIGYCELAEEEGRTAPGTGGQDFRPYLRALKSIGYQGRITMECRWDNMATQGKGAIAELRRQLSDVYGDRY